MYKQSQDRLALLQELSPGLLNEGRLLGLEKETLRVQHSGNIAQTDHPAALGAALTNPYITTDYSEALLEIVTPPLPDIDSAMHFLTEAHRFIYPRLPADELLWSTSMPCVLQDPDSIPIGRYGDSNAGLMKHIYRKGLGLRYGKAMQTIAGVHFNFSWPQAFWRRWRELLIEAGTDAQAGGSEQDFITAQYFHMTRNLLRFGWLVPFLFGSSPAICTTFLHGAPPLPGMQTFKGHTYFEPYGTSLRMGDIGYQYRKDSSSPVNVSYSGVEGYVRDLLNLVSTPHARYEEIGLLDQAGEYQQLNTNRLQIENEYYSSVRPKQIPRDQEMPLMAMADRGIRYLELRSIDVNVFELTGVDAEQLSFIEVFMLYSLALQSPEFNTHDMSVISDNMSNTAHRGRDPQLKLQTPCGAQKDRKLTDWGSEILEQMDEVAELLDRHGSTKRYSKALRAQQAKMRDPELTPSARVLREMLAHHTSFYDFARSWSVRHFETLQAGNAQKSSLPALSPADEQLFLEAATRSHRKAEKMAAESSGSLEAYLRAYFAQLDNGNLDQFRVVNS